MPGGYEYNGIDVITPPSDSDVVEVARRVVSTAVQSVVICGVFSPINSQQEDQFAAQLTSTLAQLAPGQTAMKPFAAEGLLLAAS